MILSHSLIFLLLSVAFCGVRISPDLKLLDDQGR